MALHDLNSMVQDDAVMGLKADVAIMDDWSKDSCATKVDLEVRNSSVGQCLREIVQARIDFRL
jgi:hypothetical protein